MFLHLSLSPFTKFLILKYQDDINYDRKIDKKNIKKNIWPLFVINETYCNTCLNIFMYDT